MPVPPNPVSSFLSISPNEIFLPTATTHNSPIVVEAVDLNSNPVEGANVTFAVIAVAGNVVLTFDATGTSSMSSFSGSGGTPIT